MEPLNPLADRQAPGGRAREPAGPGHGPLGEPIDVSIHPDMRGTGQRRRAETRLLRRRLGRALADRRDILVVIAVGGVVGSLARWGAGLAWPHPAGLFAWATFAVNVTGCFLIGVLMVFVTDVWPPSRYARPFFGVGVLGGFTTFSTYMLDTRSLLVAGRPAVAGAYLLGSLGAGLAAVWLAIFVTRALVTLPRVLRRRRRQRAHGAEELAVALREGIDGGFNEASRRLP